MGLIDQWRSDNEAAEQVKAFLIMAQAEYTDLLPLHAVSEKQRAFAADIRIRALASIWRSIHVHYREERFAKALLRAANRYTEAQWWIDRESHTFSYFDDLDEVIEDELERGT